MVEEALADALAPHGGAHVQVLEHHGAALPSGVRGEEKRVAHHAWGPGPGPDCAPAPRRRQLGHGAAERRRRRLEAVTLQVCLVTTTTYQLVFKANYVTMIRLPLTDIFGPSGIFSKSASS